MSSSPFMQPFEAWWLLLIFNHGGHGRYKSKVPVHHSNGTDCRPVLQQLSRTTLPNMIWHCRSQVISLDKVVHACKLKLLSFDYWFQSLCVRASVVGSIPSDQSRQPEKKRGRPSIISNDAKLGLYLCWTNSSMRRKHLSLIFGFFGFLISRTRSII